MRQRGSSEPRGAFFLRSLINTAPAVPSRLLRRFRIWGYNILCPQLNADSILQSCKDKKSQIP